MNVIGSLVVNSNAVGTNDGHKVVETWINETTQPGAGSPVAALSSTLDQLSNSSWGWTAAVNSGNASAVTIKFSNGNPAISAFPTNAQMALTTNDTTTAAASDPPQAFFKSVGQAEGRLKGLPTDRASNHFYDANAYKNFYGNSFGSYGGVPKMGVDLAEAGKTTCTLTSGTINIPLTQTDLFECFLEFAIRDAGNFARYQNVSQVKILNASNNNVLYGDAKLHNGFGNWIIWSIPMCAKAGLITIAGTQPQQGAAFNLKTEIKIELKVGAFTSDVMNTYQNGAAELQAVADTDDGLTGEFDGFIITEMRMRRAPYVAALETENIVISDIYPRRPGDFVTTRNIHKATEKFQAPKFGGKDEDTYIEADSANTVKIFTGGSRRFQANNGGIDVTGDADITGAVNAANASFTNGFTAGGGTTFESYEEGTWTPFLNGDSGQTAYGTTTANYRKIGGVVFLQLAMQSIDVIGTDSGDFEISNLPFTCAVTMVVGPVMSHSVDLANNTASGLVAYVNTSEVIKIYQIRDNASYQKLEWGTHISNGDFIFFSGFYFTDQ